LGAGAGAAMALRLRLRGGDESNWFARSLPWHGRAIE